MIICFSTYNMLLYLDISCGYVCQVYPFLGGFHHKEKKTFCSTPGKIYEERTKLYLAGVADSETLEHSPGEQSGRYRHIPVSLAKHTLFTI